MYEAIAQPWPYRYTQIVDGPCLVSAEEIALGPWAIYYSLDELPGIVERAEQQLERMKRRVWQRVADRLDTGPLT